MLFVYYRGVISEPTEWQVFFQLPDDVETDTWRPLPLKLELRNHSPTGFAWGYPGSGPSQLALALLCMELGEMPALELYHRYKDEVISHLDQDKGWWMNSSDIHRWVRTARGYGE